MRESSRSSAANNETPAFAASTETETEPSRAPAQTDESVRNPLLEDRPWFLPMNIAEMPFHIGEAADAAFATRFRQALSDRPHAHIPRDHYVTDEGLMALSDSNCPWPTPAQARFLMKAALNALKRFYHVVRKTVVLDTLEKVVQNPSALASDTLVTCKLWALFAIGEVYSSRTAYTGSSFPGLVYFAQASKMLRALSERPRIDSIEIMLLLVRIAPLKAIINQLTHPSRYTRLL